jgi:transposase-like protein
MVNEEAIQKAISDLNAQSSPNVARTAKKYGIVTSTLLRRFKGQTVCHHQAHSKSLQLLTIAQEEELIAYINKQSNRGIHLTPQILENLVVELVKHSIGSRWTRRFIQRHSDQLISRYLRAIDYSRYIADNSKHFQHFYTNVS